MMKIRLLTALLALTLGLGPVMFGHSIAGSSALAAGVDESDGSNDQAGMDEPDGPNEDEF